MSCESHEAQDKVSDLIDTAEAAIFGLTEAVTENQEMILENSRKLDALIERLNLPCG